jgi:glycosyltransferase involved in cell wall biosynthesis
VGRLSHEKGLRSLIGGFARAARQVPEALLALVGDGAMRPELEALARQANLSAGQIRFVGRVAASEIPFWLRASDIFSLTSPSEGFACALLEAMSVGLPSVVSAIPANLQLIDEGVHGLTVPFDSEEAIAEAFVKLFRDAALRQRMGNAAHLRAVENYSTAEVIERYEALFATLTMPERNDAQR